MNHCTSTSASGRRDEEVARVLELGADRRNPDGSGWVVLADAEGNEFCILRDEAARPDPYAHLVTETARERE